jgi:hypothetical protein
LLAATPNVRLRNARERTPSREHPGECLSRQELADLVNAYLWKTYAQLAEIDAGYIGKLERDFAALMMAGGDPVNATVVAATTVEGAATISSARRPSLATAGRKHRALSRCPRGP